uniref:RING-type domain-containing protein n=1 Tax=Arcella intermedia TaxID=1963864 RepID=A0A6B2L6K5_9EUKA
MDETDQSVKQIMESLGLVNFKMEETYSTCVYCDKKLLEGYGNFTTCGHGFCKTCLKSWSLSHMYKPISCRKCCSLVSIGDFTKCLSTTELQQIKQGITWYYIQETPEVVVTLCKNPKGCSGVLIKHTGYIQCPNCNLWMCTSCGVFNNVCHKQKTCEEFQLNPTPPLWVLAEEAKQWTIDNWSVSMPPIQHIYHNESLLDADCPAHIKFENGTKGLGIKDLTQSPQSYFFAWHGTSFNAIAPICRGGLDPRYRSGQAYGPGEYFGWNAGVSYGYCRGGSHMLVFVILNGPHVHAIPGFCYVVNNPFGDVAYCLPLLVVNFSFAHYPLSFERSMIASSTLPVPMLVPTPGPSPTPATTSSPDPPSAPAISTSATDSKPADSVDNNNCLIS